MSVPVGMPNLGHTAEHGRVVQWLKKPGDAVVRSEVIAVVESDKVSLDVEAPVDGRIAEILVGVGEEVAVATVLASIDDGREAPVASAPLPDAPGQSGDKPKATPGARRLAESLSIPLTELTGTGPGGRITQEDVENARAARRPPGGPSEKTGSRRLEGRRLEIARATTAAWTSVPAVPLYREVDFPDQVPGGEGDKVGPTALVATAVVRALKSHGTFNAWLLGDELRIWPSVRLAVAVDAPGGLGLATIEDADRCEPVDMGRQIAASAADVRAGGTAAGAPNATFTVSSLGGLGVDMFAPVINVPQVAILGVGRIRRQPVEAAGAIAFRQVIGLCLVFDHRANDGADGARFLSSIAQELSRLGQGRDA